MNKINVDVRSTEICGQWEVVQGLEYYGIQVPVGQLADGASIPLIAQFFIKKGGKLFTPSVIHDTGYHQGFMTRLAIDNIFMNAMVDNGVPKLKRELIYSAVRLFGASSYKGKRYD